MSDIVRSTQSAVNINVLQQPRACLHFSCSELETTRFSREQQGSAITFVLSAHRNVFKDDCASNAPLV